MYSKAIRNNIHDLEKKRDKLNGKVPNDIQAKVNNIVELYTDRKLSIHTTAHKLIEDMTEGTEKSKAKGLKAYEKAVAKYQNKAPLGERLRGVAENARISKRLNEKPKEIKQATRKIVKFMLFTTVEGRSGQIRPSFTRDGVKYYPLTIYSRGGGHIKTAVVGTVNGRIDDRFKALVKRLLRRTNEKQVFKQVLTNLKNKTNFDDVVSINNDYIEAIRIESIGEAEADISNYNERDRPLRQGGAISTYYKYIQTEIDPDAKTIKDALHKEDYKENECWINALLENYQGTELTRVKRPRKDVQTLNRDKVLELLHMTEEEFINNGASINQMDKVFKFFNIPVKLYNLTSKLIYEYSPNNYEKGKVKLFRGLVNNDHIYLLNHDLHALTQMANTGVFKASTPSNFILLIKPRQHIIKCFLTLTTSYK